MVVLDCESFRESSTTGEQHTFRLGVASFDRLTASGDPTGGTWWAQSTDSSELWWWIDSKTIAAHKTVVYAHNISFDVRISNALTHLPELGWKVRQMALNSYGFWARLKNGDRSLWLCDSLSFLPVSLEKVALAMRATKPPLPNDDDDEETWMRRCRGDVEVTREAMLRVIKYVHTHDLGDFRMTGAAQGSAAFRHRFLPAKSLLVTDDEQAIEAERRSAYTGRAEVWKHGHVSAELYEYDYQFAYARLAQQIEVPVRLQAHHAPIPKDRLRKVMQHYAILADVIVRTDVPIVPCRYEDRIVWPIGEFRSTLWDIELRMLESVGATYTVSGYWYYKRAPILRPWADWIIGELCKPESQLDPVARIMLKDWSRSLIGRFGLRYPVLDEIGSSPRSDLRLFGVSSADGHPDEKWLQVGKQLFEQTAKVESPDSVPMVMSYVMAAGRARMWQLMCAAGERNLVYVDTDGAIVTHAGAQRLDDHIRNGDLMGLRCKGSYAGGTFRAPRNIDLGNERRVSGAPRKAERLAPSVYRGEVWESLPTALARFHSDAVFVHERTFHISDDDPRRIHLPDGRTAPLEVTLENQEGVEQAA